MSVSVSYSGPDSDLQPDPTVIRAFLEWWFEKCDRGVLELGWVHAPINKLNRFAQFERSDIDALIATAIQENLIPGQSMYFRAATVKPWSADVRVTSDQGFEQSPGIWSDIDTLDDYERARGLRPIVRPNGSVITGMVPHPRVQSWFKCTDPLNEPGVVKALNVRLHRLYGGDSSVVSPSHLMRLPGLIAWPRKDGRVPELVQFVRPGPEDNRPLSYPLSLLLTQLPQIEEAAQERPQQQSDGPTGAFGFAPTGAQTVSWLINEIRMGRQWHNRMIELVAHWVGVGRSTVEILATAQYLTLAGYSAADTCAEMVKAIEGARRKWNRPDLDPIVGNTPGPEAIPEILDALGFLATFTMPDYLVDGIIQRGRLHALTSPTGHGKTAVALFLACMMAMDRNIGSIEVTQGDVLFLAGENPDDLCVRLHAACQHYGILPGALPIHVMPGNFPISLEAAESLKAKINETGRQFSLIIGDSLAAYFPGDDENHNVQMGNYARSWRVLTACAGRPAVVALAHPIKAAMRDNLLPRGGGAFLAEIDANLTLWAEGDRETTTLHWQGKIRGADFQPVTFALTPVTLSDKVDAKGRPLASVVATLRTSEEADQSLKTVITNENMVLTRLSMYPGVSIKELAIQLGWVSIAGVPNKAKVQRILRDLLAIKLVKFWRGKYLITDAGEAELKGKTGQ